ncbi:MAG: cold-shock protein [Actinomycetes bacterium]
MAVRGVVREWHAAEGWGVIDSAETPGGCWAHFSVLRMPGYRQAEQGQTVRFDFEEGWQDGYQYRAVRVEIDGVEPVEAEVKRGGTSAYRSRLVIEDPSES